MLVLTLDGDEGWDDELEQFVYTDPVVLELEHSLVSLSKWERIHETPFLGMTEISEDQFIDYILSMNLGSDVPRELLNERINEKHVLEINAYINKPMTGTTFPNQPRASKAGEKISAELIYFWMNSFSIPKEHETWHLNNLFTLIRIHQVKSEKPKKMGRSEQAARNRELNAARKARLGIEG